jgi:hypothetical protein
LAPGRAETGKDREMSTQTTVRRNWLKKQVNAGKVEARCTISLTDDYAFDNANDFGKTGWLPARIRHPEFTEYQTPGGWMNTRCSNDDHQPGYMNLDEHDFVSRSGGAYTKGDVIVLYVHSNLYYEMRIK